MQRRRIIACLVASAAAGATAAKATPQETACSAQSHVDWVSEALKRMQTIEPGMTREQLLEVFTTEGGLSTGLQRTYVSRNCPFFKVDVSFEPVGRPARDQEGCVTLEEDARDVIRSLSKPYLQFSIMD